MSFDDLARNMLARQGRKVTTGPNGDLSASIAEETRRHDKRTHLYLGSAMILIGLAFAAFAMVLFVFVPSGWSLRRNRWLRMFAMLAVAAGVVFSGVRRVVTGIRT